MPGNLQVVRCRQGRTAIYRDLERGDRADHREGEGLSLRTGRYMDTILPAALGAAVNTRRLARNPSADA